MKSNTIACWVIRELRLTFLYGDGWRHLTTQKTGQRIQ